MSKCVRDSILRESVVIRGEEANVPGPGEWRLTGEVLSFEERCNLVGVFLASSFDTNAGYVMSQCHCVNVYYKCSLGKDVRVSFDYLWARMSLFTRLIYNDYLSSRNINYNYLKRILNLLINISPLLFQFYINIYLSVSR